jgi:hypothetical protein
MLPTPAGAKPACTFGALVSLGAQWGIPEKAIGCSREIPMQWGLAPFLCGRSL